LVKPETWYKKTGKRGPESVMEGRG